MDSCKSKRNEEDHENMEGGRSLSNEYGIIKRSTMEWHTRGKVRRRTTSTNVLKSDW